MCLAALMTCLPGAAQDNITINVKANKLGSPIEKTMYGIFFEDINYAADGGLYAELVKNRSFEFTPDHLMGWQAFGNVALLEDVLGILTVGQACRTRVSLASDFTKMRTTASPFGRASLRGRPRCCASS